jgi:hypothetical protein
MSAARGSVLDTVRLQPERELHERILEGFGIRQALEEVPEEARLEGEKELRAHRSCQARITRAMAPGIFAVLDRTRERLGYEPELEVLIDPDERINATAYPTPLGGGLEVMSLTAGAVKQLDEDELACVVGHELGHLAYGHADLHAAIGLVYRADPVPELLTSRLRVLGRLHELSADRAGVVAVERDLAVAARTELLVATGLGPEHLELSLDGYAEEVARVEAFEIPHHLFDVTHPLLPIRIRALQLFCEGGTDEEVLELARLMDFESSSPAQRHARDLLLAGGLIAAHFDAEWGDLQDDQRAQLVDLVLPFTDDPEAALASVGTIDDAFELFNASAAWLRENAGPERYEYFCQFLQVTLRDGQVTELEQEFLVEAASDLDIPQAWVESRIRLHRAEAARAFAPPSSFGLRLGG